MGRLILAAMMMISLPVFADTYNSDFNAQIENLTAKAESVGKDIKVESVGVEDLEAMRVRVEG
ncbi:MAG: hypothetical protein CME71_03845 [Halobacteriovorax sp.]|nr:hypothetical protein [Halobacteriovorax sp.]|tara:strand:- start:993 stop:1181 length:189 start_codon:yes stop_codon:yes gene_type:complete